MSLATNGSSRDVHTNSAHYIGTKLEAEANRSTLVRPLQAVPASASYYRASRRASLGDEQCDRREPSDGERQHGPSLPLTHPISLPMHWLARTRDRLSAFHCDWQGPSSDERVSSRGTVDIPVMGFQKL